MEKSEFPLVSATTLVFEGRRVHGRLSRWDEAPEKKGEVKVQLEFERNIFLACSERGYFRALCNIRTQLEVQKVQIECYGSSKNVYPSPMLESMGCGERAYRLAFGKHAMSADLVNIFDTGPDVVAATVREQREFYESWLQSL